jgi:hypothetical protein
LESERLILDFGSVLFLVLDFVLVVVLALVRVLVFVLVVVVAAGPPTTQTPTMAWRGVLFEINFRRKENPAQTQNERSNN